MELGAAGAMELPPSYAYVGQQGIEQRYRTTAAACGKNLIVYAKGDVGVIPSDAIIAKLAGEGLICAVKRACDSAPFETTAKTVSDANPSVQNTWICVCMKYCDNVCGKKGRNSVACPRPATANAVRNPISQTARRTHCTSRRVWLSFSSSVWSSGAASITLS